MSAEPKELSDADLASALMGAERELVAARFKLKMNQLENTASLRVIRRRMARLATEAGRRERASGAAKGSLLGRHAKASGTAASSVEAPAKGGFLSSVVDKLAGKE